MIILMIILFFILFPVIPIILYTLVIIVKSVIPLAGIIDPGVASDAESKKGGFCFAEWTEITIIRNGQHTTIPIHQVKVGDILANTSTNNTSTTIASVMSTNVTSVTNTIVTAIIHMDGTDIQLYRIGSVYVSGSHLIRGTDGVWKSVAEDKRAIRTDAFSKTVYCFNTTTNILYEYINDGISSYWVDTSSPSISSNSSLVGAITIQDEGSNLTNAVSSINFVGSAVTASNIGNAVTVTITADTVSPFLLMGA
jgi:hypothetical protein